MTDNEIIKALECCVWVRSLSDCLKSGCPARKREGCSYFLRTDDDFEGIIFVELIKDAIDLINRQKAEIERLTSGKCVYLSDDEITEYCVEGPCPNYKTEAEIKAEAYKEFAEKVSKLICDNTYPDFDKDGKAVNIWNAKEGYKQIDNLLKEMVGDNNA